MRDTAFAAIVKDLKLDSRNHRDRGFYGPVLLKLARRVQESEAEAAKQRTIRDRVTSLFRKHGKS